HARRVAGCFERAGDAITLVPGTRGWVRAAERGGGSGEPRPVAAREANDDANLYGTGRTDARGVPQAPRGRSLGDVGRRTPRQRGVSRAPARGSLASRRRTDSSRCVSLPARGHRTDVPRAPY